MSGNNDYQRRFRGKGEYHTVLTTSHSKRPPGWVDTTQITGTTVRRITPGYISQRLPRTNTVAMNQAYIRKVISNPRTPQCNRDVAIQFVLDNPDRFTPRPTDTGVSLYDDYNHKKNGGADPCFVSRIRNLTKRND